MLGSADDDGPVIMYALAALQLRHQALDPYVRDQALAVVACGAARERWEAASAELQTARARIIEQFEADPRRDACETADLQRMIDPDEGRIF